MVATSPIEEKFGPRHRSSTDGGGGKKNKQDARFAFLVGVRVAETRKDGDVLHITYYMSRNYESAYICIYFGICVSNEAHIF